MKQTQIEKIIQSLMYTHSSVHRSIPLTIEPIWINFSGMIPQDSETHSSNLTPKYTSHLVTITTVYVFIGVANSVPIFDFIFFPYQNSFFAETYVAHQSHHLFKTVLLIPNFLKTGVVCSRFVKSIPLMIEFSEPF